MTATRRQHSSKRTQAPALQKALAPAERVLATFKRTVIAEGFQPVQVS